MLEFLLSSFFAGFFIIAGATKNHSFKIQKQNARVLWSKTFRRLFQQENLFQPKWEGFHNVSSSCLIKYWWLNHLFFRIKFSSDLWTLFKSKASTNSSSENNSSVRFPTNNAKSWLQLPGKSFSL
jgi:hypothetical protein